jgi:hypothetical protein
VGAQHAWSPSADVVLVAEVNGRKETVRVYDGAHGKNELHRYTRDGSKRAAEVFDRGTLGEGLEAIATVSYAGTITEGPTEEFHLTSDHWLPSTGETTFTIAGK